LLQAAKLAKQGAIDRELADHFGVIPIARPCSRLTDPLCQGVGAKAGISGDLSAVIVEFLFDF
jgi:hypothetical protein